MTSGSSLETTAIVGLADLKTSISAKNWVEMRFLIERGTAPRHSVSHST